MEKFDPRFPKVCIILVNWNGRDNTIACLESLKRIDYPDYETILVDNASQDGSIEALKGRGYQISILENSQNNGFVGGNNDGIKISRNFNPKYLLLLNNDTEVAPDFLTRLVDETEKDGQIGIVGPIIYYYADPKKIWSAGGKIDWRLGKTSMVGIDENDQGQFGNTAYRVDFVTGCCLLIRMDLIDRIGPLDERFFMYYEETEWCARATSAGYKIKCVPQSKVWHKISAAVREDSFFVNYYMTRNRLLFLKLTKAGLVPLFRTLIFENLRTYISWTVKPKWRSKKLQKKALVQGVIDFSRGKFGKVDI